MRWWNLWNCLAKHPALNDKPLEFSKGKHYEHEEQKQLLKDTTSSNVSALSAWFLVSNFIAKAKKTFTIGEELILPAAKDIYHELFEEAAAQKAACAPLSISTITRRIDEIGGSWGTTVRENWWVTMVLNPDWQVYQYWQQGNSACFGATNFSGECAWGYVVCTLLPANAAATEIFKSLNGYISGKLNWSFCVGIHTDDGEDNGTPLQYSWLGNPMDKGA